jgi:transporter family protein
MKAVGARVPAWLLYSTLTVLLWGAWGVQSKLLVGRTSPFTGQVLFTAGMVVPVAMVLASRRRFQGRNIRRGFAYAVLTGMLGGAGNVAFYVALVDGKVSLIGPITSLYPLVTVLLARVTLNERMSRAQLTGVGLALFSIYLLTL